MKFILLLVILFSSQVSADVSVTKYNDLVDKYNILQSLYNSNAKCDSYYSEARAISSRLNKKSDHGKFYSYLNIEHLNAYLYKTFKDPQSTENITLIISTLKFLLENERKTSEDLASAKLAIKLTDKYLTCTKADDKRSVNFEKKLMVTMIEGIQKTQRQADEFYQHITDSYGNKEPYQLVLDENKTDNSLPNEYQALDYILSTATSLTVSDKEYPISDTFLLQLDNELCELGIHFRMSEGVSYDVEIDFNKKLHWGQMNKNSASFFLTKKSTATSWSDNNKKHGKSPIINLYAGYGLALAEQLTYLQNRCKNQ